jgi:hypothetical protein
MPKLGRSLGIANLPNRILDVYFPSSLGPTGNIYTEPTDLGSAVTIEAVTPFTEGYSYLFTESDNSYLDISNDESWAVGTQDFTIEWFQRQTTTSGFQRVFTVDDYPDIDIGVSVENSTFYYWANSSFRYSSASSTVQNTWYHWAVVRQNGVTKVYRDGSLRGSQITDTNNITNATDILTIGNENLGKRAGDAGSLGAFKGYITNFRWVKGLAVYTGNFTTPTSELTLIANANPYGGSNTQAIPAGYTKLLLIPTLGTSRILTDQNDLIITDDSKYIIYGT